MSTRADWVARFLKRELTPFQREAVELLCDAQRCGPYDFTSTWKSADWECGRGVMFIVRAQWSTYDTDGLTLLVVGAHDRCIRVEIEGCAPGYLRVYMHPRTRDGDQQGTRHPSIEEALAKMSKYGFRYPAQTDAA